MPQLCRSEPAEEGDDPGCEDSEACEGAGDGEQLAGETPVVYVVGSVGSIRLGDWLGRLVAIGGVGRRWRVGVRGGQRGCGWEIGWRGGRGGFGLVWS